MYIKPVCLAPGNAALNTQRGYTLLEMMIAVLIISFGLLGLAGLQATALKNNHGAYLRSIATQLAYEMADRIRANKGVDYSAISPTPHGGCSISCTPTELAEDDLSGWQQQVASDLPLGNAPVPTKAPDGTYQITVSWDDTRSGTASLSLTTSFLP